MSRHDFDGDGRAALGSDVGVRKYAIDSVMLAGSASVKRLVMDMSNSEHATLKVRAESGYAIKAGDQ
ncbi:hypothetical protein R5O87_17625 [Arthrobacter globiformis]|uniref:hypothetical protein n=1 Tax=Arthrobacter globiformis TaxID=1665 RepID=UPI00397D17B2